MDEDPYPRIARFWIGGDPEKRLGCVVCRRRGNGLRRRSVRHDVETLLIGNRHFSKSSDLYQDDLEIIREEIRTGRRGRDRQAV